MYKKTHVDQRTTPLAECRQHLMNGYGKGFHVITARRCSTRDSLLLLSSSGIRGRLLDGRLSPSLDTSLPRRSACEITQRRLQGGTESPRSAAPRKPAAPTRKHAASSDGVPGTAAAATLAEQREARCGGWGKSASAGGGQTRKVIQVQCSVTHESEWCLDHERVVHHSGTPAHRSTPRTSTREQEAIKSKEKRRRMKTKETHVQKPSGGGTSVGERRNGFNARCHSADASVKRSVGSHHASPTRTTNNKNKKRTKESARTREAQPPRCRRGTSVRTQISWLSAGLLFPQRRAATEAATGLVDTDAMCLYILATARIQPSLSLSLFEKRKTKTKAFQALLAATHLSLGY